MHPELRNGMRNKEKVQLNYDTTSKNGNNSRNKYNKNPSNNTIQIERMDKNINQEKGELKF